MGPAASAIKLLIVDHSPVAREMLRGVFTAAPDIEIAGEVGTALKAMRLVEELSPTAVLVDCDLPSPGSFALVRDMMTLHRIPVIMLAKKDKAAAAALESKALDAGAVALATLSPASSSSDRSSRDNLVRTVRVMSEVKVVRRRRPRSDLQPASSVGGPSATRSGRSANPRAPLPELEEHAVGVEIVAIGASTGGPQALETILGGLAKRLTVPVIVVQHLSQGFQNNLISWLADTTGAQIRVGQHGMPLTPGFVYLAPDNKHTGVNGSGCLVLNDDPPENGSKPSVSVLFRSVAQHYGPHAIGILLTGMGRDGAKELRLMRDRGAITIAQDEETSAVYGMPGEAIKLKGARYVLPPERVVSVVQHHLPATAAAPREGVTCL
jgi:two-component system chemotaxis response regulator CheB